MHLVTSKHWFKKCTRTSLQNILINQLKWSNDQLSQSCRALPPCYCSSSVVEIFTLQAVILHAFNTYSLQPLTLSKCLVNGQRLPRIVRANTSSHRPSAPLRSIVLCVTVQLMQHLMLLPCRCRTHTFIDISTAYSTKQSIMPSWCRTVLINYTGDRAHYIICQPQY